MTDNGLSYRRLKHCTCFVDVALTVVSDNGQCLGWTSHSHFHILRDILHMSHANAVRMSSPGSSQYTRDITSHLPDVAGFRVAPGIRAGGTYEIRYAQAYGTEKALTASKEKGRHAKFLECPDIFDGKADAWIDALYRLNLNAIDSNLATARLEVRVPLSNAPFALLGVDEVLLRSCLIKVPPVIWWLVTPFLFALFP
jgi:hypothetical protein